MLQVFTVACCVTTGSSVWNATAIACAPWTSCLELVWSYGFRFLSRPLGHFTLSLIGFKKIIFRNIFQRALMAILGSTLGLLAEVWKTAALVLVTSRKPWYLEIHVNKLLANHNCTYNPLASPFSALI